MNETQAKWRILKDGVPLAVYDSEDTARETAEALENRRDEKLNELSESVRAMKDSLRRLKLEQEDIETRAREQEKALKAEEVLLNEILGEDTNAPYTIEKIAPEGGIQEELFEKP